MMNRLAKTLVVLATVGVTAVPLGRAAEMKSAHQAVGASAPVRATAGRAVPSHTDVQYSKRQKEYYWTDEEKSWARPGMTVEIVSVSIPADRHPVVELKYYDDLGQPLDRTGIETPGTISFSFVIAWYDGALNQYTAYTVRPAGDTEQASTDSGGSMEDVAIGHSLYTFGTQLPDGYDMTKTHTVYVYSTR
ncbi:MAG: hypothetical protein P8Y93_13410, partial [Acidobacteriota bacterium]